MKEKRLLVIINIQQPVNNQIGKLETCLSTNSQVDINVFVLVSMMPFLDLKNVKTLRACMREVVLLLRKTTAKQKRNLEIINILQASSQRHCSSLTKMLSLLTCCSRKNEISLVVDFSSKSLVRSSEPSNKMNRKDDKIWGETLEGVSFYY